MDARGPLASIRSGLYYRRSVKPKTRQLKIDLSAAVRARLAADADQQETSINNVAVGILADHFGVAFVGSGRRGPGARTTDAGQVVWQVPIALWKKIHVAATSPPSKREIVEQVLREHYQLDDVAVAAA